MALDDFSVYTTSAGKPFFKYLNRSRSSIKEKSSRKASKLLWVLYASTPSAIFSTCLLKGRQFPSVSPPQPPSFLSFLSFPFSNWTCPFPSQNRPVRSYLVRLHFPRGRWNNFYNFNFLRRFIYVDIHLCRAIANRLHKTRFIKIHSPPTSIVYIRPFAESTQEQATVMDIFQMEHPRSSNIKTASSTRTTEQHLFSVHSLMFSKCQNKFSTVWPRQPTLMFCIFNVNLSHMVHGHLEKSIFYYKNI